MVTTLPILSDIIKDVVARVNIKTQAFLVNPFSVLFEFGPLSEVSKSVYQKVEPVIWLIEKGESRRSKGLYAKATCDIVIGMPTDSTWTMTQRIDNNYKPRLFPLYETLINEIKIEKRFSNPYENDHNKHNLYYWGGGPVNGTNASNLWEKMIDAILIENMLLQVRNKC